MGFGFEKHVKHAGVSSTPPHTDESKRTHKLSLPTHNPTHAHTHTATKIFLTHTLLILLAPLHTQPSTLTHSHTHTPTHTYSVSKALTFVVSEALLQPESLLFCTSLKWLTPCNATIVTGALQP